jgi:hypothetical protein
LWNYRKSAALEDSNIAFAKELGKLMQTATVKALGQTIGIAAPTWECKQCHQDIGEELTVALHLIDGVLYGWCEACFTNRNNIPQPAA